MLAKEFPGIGWIGLCDINEELGRKDRMAHQYGNLGIIYRVQGRLDEAEAVYRQALEINRAEDQKEGMAEDYNNLGNVYQERGRLDPDPAAPRCEQAHHESLVPPAEAAIALPAGSSTS